MCLIPAIYFFSHINRKTLFLFLWNNKNTNNNNFINNILSVIKPGPGTLFIRGTTNQTKSSKIKLNQHRFLVKESIVYPQYRGTGLIQKRVQ